jgi:breast cancer 2 susceptibility protein
MEYKTTNNQSEGTLFEGDNAIVELTDGWYSVNAILDHYLTNHLHRGQLFIGLKLRIFGAEIVGSGIYPSLFCNCSNSNKNMYIHSDVGRPDQPQEPLEVCDSTMLKLCVNGVRRAKWYDKLGFQRKYVSLFL